VRRIGAGTNPVPVGERNAALVVTSALDLTIGVYYRPARGQKSLGSAIGETEPGSVELERHETGARVGWVPTRRQVHRVTVDDSVV
jgi:hypothetical protein